VAGEVGVPLGGVDLRLVDEQGLVNGDGSGEIRVKGASLFSGYHRRPDATKAAFDADGYFITGDLAERKDGRYRILGRQSVDILKSGGYKISALQIESVLLEAEVVAQACVVGVDDEVYGQRIVAIIVPRDQAAEVDAEALLSMLKTRLAPYKIPRAFLYRDELIKNAMGKVQKKPLVAWAQAQLVASQSDPEGSG